MLLIRDAISISESTNPRENDDTTDDPATSTSGEETVAVHETTAIATTVNRNLTTINDGIYTHTQIHIYMDCTAMFSCLLLKLSDIHDHTYSNKRNVLHHVHIADLHGFDDVLPNPVSGFCLLTCIY